MNNSWDLAAAALRMLAARPRGLGPAVIRTAGHLSRPRIICLAMAGRLPDLLVERLAFHVAPEQDRSGTEYSGEAEDTLPLSRDMVIEAVRAMLPPEILAGLGRMRATKGADGSGAAQMVRRMPDVTVIGINPALSYFDGLSGVLCPIMVRMLAAVQFTARLFAGTSARPDRIRSLVESTGPRIDAACLELYRWLVARKIHVKRTLSMMAQWDLEALLTALPIIGARTLFITASNDQSVPPRIARAAAGRMPGARPEEIEGHGQLIHEEIPERTAEICCTFIIRN